MKRILFLVASILLFGTSKAQITEDFADGDFADGNPLTWTVSQTSGDDDFMVVSGEVQSDGPSASSGDIYLATDFGIDFLNNDVVWTFKARYTGGGPSGSNRIEIYLISDIEDVTGTPQGYYIGMGETGSGDGIDFFKTNSGTALITDAGDLVGSGIDIHVRVTRTSTGMWTLEADPTGGNTFATIGSVTDTDFTSGDFFGFYVQHTSTRFDDFFFDDVTLTLTPLADMTPPLIQSVSAISSTQVDVTFNEDVDETTAEEATNYMLDGGITISSAMRDDIDNSIVHLTTSALTNGQSYTITINNVQDLSTNVIATNSQAMFEYLMTEEAVAEDIVINEFHASPGSGSTIPNAEFIELFNRSAKFVDLGNWTFSDESGTSSAFSSFVIRPDSFLILTDVGDGTLFSSYGDVLEVSGFRALNNGGDSIIIRNSSSTIIHEINYTASTSEISTELINPNGPDYSESNYGLSTDPDGGTPGEQNSIFDDTPDTTLPSINSISVVSSTQLDVTFSEILDETSAETIANYTIDGGISVAAAQRDDADNTIVHLTVSTLVSGETRTLTINNVEDLSGNSIAANSTIDFEYVETVPAVEGDVVINEFLADPVDNNNDFVELYNRSDKFLDLAGWNLADGSSTSDELPSFVLRPASFVIIYDEDASEDYPSFGDALSIPSLTLNNTDDQIEILDDSDVRIAFVSYTDQPSEGISSELVNPDDPCLSELSFEASTDASGSTPGRQNSVFDDTPDTLPPSITSTNFDEKLTINFSETMDVASLLAGSYAVSGLTIEDISADAIPTSVEITFIDVLVTGVIYEMTISDVLDCQGNAIEATTISFGLGRSPEFNELIITEIMFDPDPAVGLPEQEYIEIFNSTSDLINTVGMSYSDATSVISLPSVTLNPMSYAVFTTTSGISEFPGVNVVGVSGFPSLNNSGEQLTLSKDDDLIFAIEYDPSWHDEEKSDGGYSLEMKDVTNPCGEDANWGSSIDPLGGTPGLINSLVESIPDNFGPQVLLAVAQSSDTVRVDFDEKLDPSAESLAGVTFEPALAVANLFYDFRLPKSLFIVLAEDLATSVQHAITLSNITDCNGNEVQAHDVSFALPAEAETGEILLSEVLFNPRTNGVDFVELYNSSERFLSLKNWQLARITEDGVDDGKVISSEELVLNPGDFLALTTNTGVLFGEYPLGNSDRLWEVESLPTYANDTGNVVLLDAEGVLQELFHYEDDFHYDLLESADGVSLERISYDGATNDPNNWRSASSTVGFATPGYENSQAFSPGAPSGKVVADPQVFIPGNSGSGRDFTTINYQFDQPGKFANITIYDQTGRLVKNLAEGALLSTSGFLRWDGTSNAGELARLGYYVILFEVYDSAGTSEVIKETVVVGRDF